MEDLSSGVFVPVHAEGVHDGEAGPRETHLEVEDGGCSEQEALLHVCVASHYIL